MFVLSVVHVVLSFGSMPSRVQTFPMIWPACSLVKAWGILRTLVSWEDTIGFFGCTYLIQPWLRKCSFCSGVRTGSVAMVKVVCRIYRKSIWTQYSIAQFVGKLLSKLWQKDVFPNIDHEAQQRFMCTKHMC